MGMAYVTLLDERIRRSTAYPGCWYCPRCEATYSAGGGKWHYVSHARGSTSPGDDHAWGGFETTDGQCPVCRRKPEPDLLHPTADAEATAQSGDTTSQEAP